MLKDLIFTLILMCGCLLLLIGLHQLHLPMEWNILMSSCFVYWGLRRCVAHTLFQQSSLLMMFTGILLLNPLEHILWAFVGALFGDQLYRITHAKYRNSIKNMLSKILAKN